MAIVESKENIKARMLEEAAKIWGYQNEALEQAHFDPFVDLLMGACASELEKISHEIHATRNRVMERLVELTSPEVLTGALPAHAVLQVQPVEPVSIALPADQFTHKRTNGHSNKEVFFSPAGQFKIFDGKIAYTACGSKLFQHLDAAHKELLLLSKSQKELSAGVLWLGLELHEDIHFPEGLTFYFDWKNELDKSKLLQWLSLAKWYLQGVELFATPGIEPYHSQEEQYSAVPTINAISRIEEHARAFYSPHFITLHHPKNGGYLHLQAHKQQHPPEFEAIFMPEELKVFKKEIIWIKVQFPEVFPTTSLESLDCSINCFPVLNRRLNRFVQNLQPDFNLVPLKSDGYFLDMYEVENGSGRTFTCIPGGASSDQDEDACYLRRKGASRQGEFTAMEALQHLLELVRSEGSAIAAQGQDLLQTQLMELNQLLHRLAKNIKLKDHPIEEIPFLFVKVKEKGQTLHVQFWSTEGGYANRLPAGTPMDIGTSSSFKKNMARLISTTMGGRNPQNAIDKVSAYREALVSQGRVVTTEDICSVCRSQLGSDVVKHIEVKKGVATGVLPHEGLQRVIRVILTPKNRLHPSPEEWQSICRELQVLLKNRSPSVLPFQVEINNVQ